MLAGLDRHIDYGAGISNTLLERLGRMGCSSDFKGVYSADYIPQKQLARVPRFLMIVNLGERRGKRGTLPVGHFVSICAEPSKIKYLDPYGLRCYQPKVVKFLKLCNRPVVENKTQVQDLSSVYCGFFCLLFVMYEDLCNGDAAQKPDFKVKFYKRSDKLKQNDILCMRYLKRLNARL